MGKNKTDNKLHLKARLRFPSNKLIRDLSDPQPGHNNPVAYRNGQGGYL